MRKVLFFTASLGFLSHGVAVHHAFRQMLTLPRLYCTIYMIKITPAVQLQLLELRIRNGIPQEEADIGSDRSAFLSVLKEKPLEEISVTEWSQKAHINRSAFYAHSLDVYDLMDQVTARFAKRMFTNVIAPLDDPAPTGEYNALPMILSALELTIRNQDLCEPLDSREREPFRSAERQGAHMVQTEV